MRVLDGRCVLDADSIRKILTSVSKPDPPAVIDPRGIRIRGAHIEGQLDLDGVSATIGLQLTGCRLDRAPTLRDAKLPWLMLDTCVLPGLCASTAKFDILRVRDCSLSGDDPDAIIDLNGVQVSELSLAGTSITNPSGPALAADGCTVNGDLKLTTSPGTRRKFTARGSASTGTVLLRGATISGQLSLEEARVGALRQALSQESSPGEPDGESPAWRQRSVGAVCLSGSTITGNLVLRSAVFDGDSRPALMGENLTVKGHAATCDFRQQGFRATGSGALGAVCLAGANITGQLALRGVTLINKTGPALLADLITIGAGALLDDDFFAGGAGPAGAVRLPEATIHNELRLNGALLVNPSGPALLADGVTVQGHLLLRMATMLSRPPGTADADHCAAILLRGATVGGHLSLDGAVVRFGALPAGGGDPAEQGAAARAEVLSVAALLRREIARRPGGGLAGSQFPVRQEQVEGALRPDGALAGGCDSLGAVCLTGSTVTGRLELRRTLLLNQAGPALLADYLTVKSDAAVCEQAAQGLTAIGSGSLGAVCFAAAAISGQLALRGSTLVNMTGPALLADSAQIQGDALIDETFAALGISQQHGAVSFQEAGVGKTLSCAGWFLSAGSGVALNLSRGKVGTLQIGRQSEQEEDRNRFDAHGRFRFDGLSYTGLPVLGAPALLSPPPEKAGRWDPGWLRRRRKGQAGTEQVRGQHIAQWLSWFRHNIDPYEAQPYEALAAAYGGAGYDDLARAILVAQREDVRQRGSLSWARKRAQFFAKWLIGYGYHCFYAFVWLAALLVITALIAAFWFGPEKYIQQVATATPVASATPAPTPSGSASRAAGRRRIAGGRPLLRTVPWALRRLRPPARNAAWPGGSATRSNSPSLSSPSPAIRRGNATCPPAAPSGACSSLAGWSVPWPPPFSSCTGSA